MRVCTKTIEACAERNSRRRDRSNRKTERLQFFRRIKTNIGTRDRVENINFMDSTRPQNSATVLYAGLDRQQTTNDVTTPMYDEDALEKKIASALNINNQTNDTTPDAKQISTMKETTDHAMLCLLSELTEEVKQLKNQNAARYEHRNTRPAYNSSYNNHRNSYQRNNNANNYNNYNRYEEPRPRANEPTQNYYSNNQNRVYHQNNDYQPRGQQQNQSKNE